MSEKSKPPFDEWINHRLEETKRLKTRAETLKDTSSEENKALWEWFEVSFSELSNLFYAIQLIAKGNRKHAKKLDERMDAINKRIDTILRDAEKVMTKSLVNSVRNEIEKHETNYHGFGVKIDR